MRQRPHLGGHLRESTRELYAASNRGDNGFVRPERVICCGTELTRPGLIAREYALRSATPVGDIVVGYECAELSEVVAGSLVDRIRGRGLPEDPRPCDRTP
jgi:hypothetical protein